uniref:Tyrosine-protein phosphatase domain-containing protein n=1 Tax=Parastrongyloides trichosuri TaxID=131310 RepID=A0A0N5A595_PARTI
MDETPSPFNNNSYRENESIQLCDIANSFHDYFPEDDEEKIYGKFIIKKCSKMRLLGNQIEWTEYSMEKNTNSNNKIIKFKVFKFFSHISTKEDDNNISYNILCETILKNSPNASILLQDPFGISTSAVMALIIMMIDNIPLYHYFDPVSYFIALREIRLNAIMYDYHFLFAILVVIRYYEDKISFLEEGLIEKLTKYIKNEMNHFKNLDKELSRL